MNSLEDIPYSAVEAGGIPYVSWRKTLRPRFGIVWRDLGLGFAAIILVFLLSFFVMVRYPQLAVPVLPAGAALAGFFLAYLSLFMHEASHYNLHPDKKKNDRLATVLLCLLFGQDLRSYRSIHWQHHRHLGTPADTETSYFNALTPRFLFESFTGIHLLRVMRKKKNAGAISDSMKKNSKKMLLAGAATNAAIVAALFWCHWVLSLQWIVAMVLFFPFFATLRQILEHRHEQADTHADYTRRDHGKVSRIFTDGLFSRLFGGAGFNRHMIHHWDPQVSYTRLGDVEAFLRQSPATSALLQDARTTYGRTLKSLLSR